MTVKLDTRLREELLECREAMLERRRNRLARERAYEQKVEEITKAAFETIVRETKEAFVTRFFLGRKTEAAIFTYRPLCDYTADNGGRATVWAARRRRRRWKAKDTPLTEAELESAMRLAAGEDPEEWGKSQKAIDRLTANYDAYRDTYAHRWAAIASADYRWDEDLQKLV